jgi:predicted transcriptional regulator
VEQLGKLDQQILLSLKKAQLSIEEIVELVDADQSETVSAIRRLIANGYLQLVISSYPWGFEFALQLADQRSS